MRSPARVAAPSLEISLIRVVRHTGQTPASLARLLDAHERALLAGEDVLKDKDGTAVTRVRLEALDVNVVVVEEDEALARDASEELSDAMVIRGLPTDQKLLQGEDIERVATFVAVTHDHEMNLVAGLLAKRLGAGRAADDGQ